MDAKADIEAASAASFCHTFPLLPIILSFVFLTVNAIFAVIRVRRDPWTLAFVVSVYLLIMLFFLFVYIAVQMRPESPSRRRLKVPIWILSTALVWLVGYRVSVILSPGFAWSVWAMALLSTSSTFWVLFVCGDEPKDDSSESAGDCTKMNSCHGQQTLPTRVNAV